MSDIESTVLRLVEKWWADLRTERHGIVTSYDPDTHLGKVMLQPEQQETGWLPIETGHIGDGYGIAVGLQPGDGKEKGDQVVVRYQEGDLESGKIALRVHSDDQKPPKVESGELVIWTRFQKSDGGSESAQGAQGGEGQKLFFKKDGSMEYTDGNGATMIFDGNGNVDLQCNNYTVRANGTITIHAKGDLGLKGDGNAELNSGGVTGIDAGSTVIVKGGGDVSDGSITQPSGQPSVPPFQVP